MIVAVEGMDGVGKTEVSKHIRDRFKFKFIEKPLHYFYSDESDNQYNDLMKVATKMYDINDNMIKSWYFSLGNIYAARMFQNEDIVIDRHLVSNYYWNGDLDSEPIFDTLIKCSGVPDLTILLYAKPETRVDRMKKRNPNDPDLYDMDKLEDGYTKMMYFLEKFNLPYVVIDTDDKSLDEVNKIVDTIILEIKQNNKRLIKRLI